MISAVVITKNARETIGNCLDALLKVTDDVIVVDSGSTDGTKEICLSRNVKYFLKDWEGYSANKNFGNDQAKYDYILSMDSDEIISDKLIESIKQEFQRNELCDAYSVNFITYYCGKWLRYGDWNPNWHIRIFNRKIIRWQMLDVHEVLTIGPHHKIKKLQGNTYHYSYPTVESHLQKIENYTNLFAERGFKAGVKANRARAVVSGLFSFFSGYLLKLGLLDGYYGFVVAKNNARYSYLKYIKLSKKYQN